MAGKKAKKTLAKKSMKKTKGGILIGLNQPSLSPTFVKIQTTPQMPTDQINFVKF